MLRLATDVTGIRQVEIRCDPRNAPSAGVPRRPGFRLVSLDSPGDAGATMLRVYVVPEEPRT